jgi:oleate hydratase
MPSTAPGGEQRNGDEAEYSIRSAQTAVYTLLGLKREAPTVCQGRFDPRAPFNAFVALHDLAS